MVGEAGVGKSRLVHEFVLSHHIQGWRVLESASVPYGKATPYFPVIDLLKRYAHVEEHADTRTLRAKVTGQILTVSDCWKMLENRRCGNAGGKRGGQDGAGITCSLPAPPARERFNSRFGLSYGSFFLR